MGVFVRVTAPTCKPLQNRPVFAGQLVPRSRELLSDYNLCDLEASRSIACIDQYPRGTETGLALFLRLLLNAERGHLAHRFDEDVMVALSTGSSPTTLFAHEILHICRDGLSARISLLSPAGLVADRPLDLELIRN